MWDWEVCHGRHAYLSLFNDIRSSAKYQFLSNTFTVLSFSVWVVWGIWSAEGILSALSTDSFDQFSQCYPTDCTDRRLKKDTQWISSLIMDLTFLQTGGIILLRSPWSSDRHLQDTGDLLEWQTFPGWTRVSLTQFNLGKSSLFLQFLYLNDILFLLSITP